MIPAESRDTEMTLTGSAGNVLSIQSHVTYGHVGNAAAAFPLQRLGFEVWRINTVQFSNHTGYGDWRGEVFSPEHVADLIEGLDARGALARCDGVLSGYMGDAALGEVVVEAVSKVKSANPGALYLCDPVMGDSEQGLYVRPGIPEFMRERAIPAADVIAPNLFELEVLTGQAVTDLASVIAAARRVMETGPRTVLVTSLTLPGAPKASIQMLAVDAGGAWLVTTPLLPLDPAPNGAGDTVAALFLAHLLKGSPTPEALARVAGAIFAVMEATRDAASRELQLIAAQDELVSPGRSFPVTALE
jgi:pyridoxine kinase